METKALGWVLMGLGAVLCVVAIIKFAVVGFYPTVVGDWVGYAIAGAAGVLCLRVGIYMIDDE